MESEYVTVRLKKITRARLEELAKHAGGEIYVPGFSGTEIPCNTTRGGIVVVHPEDIVQS